MLVRKHFADQKNDVLLVNPPEIFEDNGEKIRANLSLDHPSGILALSASLRKEKLKVVIIDALAERKSINDIIDVINKTKPNIVGISATSPQIRGAFQLASTAKKIFGSNISIALGGSHISADPDFYNRFSRIFDFAIVGEGEVTFTELASRIVQGGNITGLYYGKITENLDSLPYPERDLLKWEYYSHPPYKSNFVSINTVRGCPFHCSFCSNPVYGRKVRYRSVESVLGEIIYCIKKYRIRFITFADDTFSLNRKRIVDLCEGLLMKNIKVYWGVGTRANLVDKQLLELMYRAGCRDIGFGIETGNEKLRAKVVKKEITTEQIVEAFKISRKIGFETGALCMLGFPGETIEMIRETIELAIKIKPHIFGFHLTVLMPESPLYKIALKEGKIKKDIWDNYAKGDMDGQPIYIPDGFTLDELKKIQINAYRSFYFRPSYLLDKLCFDIKFFSKLTNDVKIGLNLLLGRKTGTGRL